MLVQLGNASACDEMLSVKLLCKCHVVTLKIERHPHKVAWVQISIQPEVGEKPNIMESFFTNMSLKLDHGATYSRVHRSLRFPMKITKVHIPSALSDS